MRTSDFGCKDYWFNFKENRIHTGVNLVCAGYVCLNETDNNVFTIPTVKDSYTLLAVSDGNGVLDLDGTNFALNASDAFILFNCNEATIRFKNKEQSCTFFYSILNDKTVNDIVNKFPESAFSPFPLKHSSFVLDRFADLLRDAQLSLITDSFQGSQHGFGLLMELCRNFEADTAQLHPELVRDAIAIIEEEYPYLFGVEELAESLEVSKHHLIRQFTRSVGISPGKHLSKTRIHHAKLLLKDPQYSIEIVGQLVGYANGNYFCKAFRSHVGMSPREYRKKYCLHQIDNI